MIVLCDVFVFFWWYTEHFEQRSKWLLDNTTTIKCWKWKKVEESNTNREKCSKYNINLNFNISYDEWMYSFSCCDRTTEWFHSFRALFSILRCYDSFCYGPKWFTCYGNLIIGLSKSCLDRFEKWHFVEKILIIIKIFPRNIALYSPFVIFLYAKFLNRTRLKHLQ